MHKTSRYQFQVIETEVAILPRAIIFISNATLNVDTYINIHINSKVT